MDFKKLENESINKLIIKYAIPATMGMMVNGIYAIVDGIFVGNYVGYYGIASVAFAWPFLISIYGLGIMFGLGGATLISINLGMKNKDEAEKILSTTFLYMIIVSAIITITGMPITEILLKVIGAEGIYYTEALNYSSIFIYGALITLSTVSFDSLVRNDGFPKKAMYAMATGAVLNIILDGIAIAILGYGIMGAAVATLLSQFVVFIIYLEHFLGGKSNLKLKLFEKLDKTSLNNKYNSKKEEILDYLKNIHTVKKIFLAGFSGFLGEFAFAMLIFVHNIQFLAYGSPLQVSAFGTVSYLSGLAFFIIYGVSIGIQPLISYNYGADKIHRVREIFKKSSLLNLIFGMIIFAIASIFAEPLVQLFNASDTAFVNASAFGLKIHSAYFAIVGITLVCITYFQSVYKYKISILLMLARSTIFLIPLIIILPFKYGLEGIWYAMPIAEYLALVVSLLFVKHHLYDTKKFSKSEIKHVEE
ncbi:MATE family efflux transporter [Methanococcus voltae]|uniref:Multidrug export protein MepA n=1 Tax=Methanococcus voltae (strain ATCC BAA-1334 / A3) TaxID=456320 RepID=D7DSH3_METV3|nr:MATE family efflux transporter [Methanococcus voltae]MCS3901609.1 putative MATE family efflux protein [Methanococcus voltae]